MPILFLWARGFFRVRLFPVTLASDSAITIARFRPSKDSPDFKKASKISKPLRLSGGTPTLSGPVRDTPPYRAIPFRDGIAEGSIAPIYLVFIGYRAGIAEIPLLRGVYRTSTSHTLQGGNAQKRGRGYRTQLAILRHQKPHSAQ